MKSHIPKGESRSILTFHCSFCPNLCDIPIKRIPVFGFGGTTGLVGLGVAAVGLIRSDFRLLSLRLAASTALGITWTFVSEALFLGDRLSRLRFSAADFERCFHFLLVVMLLLCCCGCAHVVMKFHGAFLAQGSSPFPFPS